jgi:hydroxymethylbilane synthase
VSAERIIIGSRGSALARWQAEHVAAALRAAHPGIEIRIEIIVTEGDRFQSGPLIEIGGKGVWVKEIEEALLENRIDLAVHSLKDVPGELAPGLDLLAIPPRADARDALVTREGHTLSTLPAGSRVGTSSLRRVCQIKRLRPDLVVEVLRGNVDTRLNKVATGIVDAAVLACAGLDRLGHADRIAERLAPETMLPAIAQGALGLEGRAHDPVTRAQLTALHDSTTAQAVTAERALLRGLGGTCRTPLGGYAVITNGTLTLRGLVGSPDGLTMLSDSLTGNAADATSLGLELARRMRESGADRILAAAG